MSEDEDILRFRYQKMNWKVWALVIGVNAVLYFVVSAIRSLG